MNSEAGLLAAPSGNKAKVGLRFRFSPPEFQGAERQFRFPNWAAREPEECFSFSRLKEKEVV